MTVIDSVERPTEEDKADIHGYADATGRGSRLRRICGFVASCVAIPAAAADHFGRVTFNGLPVPGATVTATQRDQQLVTVTDQDGVFRFAALADGAWTIRVEMIGFAALSRDITPSPPTRRHRRGR